MRHAFVMILMLAVIEVMLILFLLVMWGVVIGGLIK